MHVMADDRIQAGCRIITGGITIAESRASAEGVLTLNLGVLYRERELN